LKKGRGERKKWGTLKRSASGATAKSFFLMEGERGVGEKSEQQQQQV